MEYIVIFGLNIDRIFLSFYIFFKFNITYMQIYNSEECILKNTIMKLYVDNWNNNYTIKKDPQKLISKIRMRAISMKTASYVVLALTLESLTALIIRPAKKRSNIVI